MTNVDVVRRLLEDTHALGQGRDLGPEFSALSVEDFEFLPAPELPLDRVYRGVDGFFEFMRTWL